MADPDPLPKTYDWFRHATLNATLHQRSGTDVWADVETVDGDAVSGRVTQIRQAFVDPSTNDYSLENSLFVATDGGEVTVGGPGAFMEDHEAESTTLRSVE